MEDKVHSEALRRLNDHAASVLGHEVVVKPQFMDFANDLLIGFECDAPALANATMHPVHIPLAGPARKGRPSNHAEWRLFFAGDDEHQADILIRAFDLKAVPNIEYGQRLQEVLDGISQSDMEMLNGFSATTSVSGPDYWHVLMRWNGLGNSLREGPTRVGFSNYDKRQWDGLASTLRQNISRQKRLRKLAERGITMEPPLVLKLQSLGADPVAFADEVCAIDLAEMTETYKHGIPMRTIKGHQIKPGIVDGHIRGSFALTDAISWKQGSVVVAGMTLPDTVRTAYKGCPLRSMVDHPWLEGYEVSSVCQTATTVTIQTVSRTGPVLLSALSSSIPLAA